MPQLPGVIEVYNFPQKKKVFQVQPSFGCCWVGNKSTENYWSQRSHLAQEASELQKAGGWEGIRGKDPYRAALVFVWWAQPVPDGPFPCTQNQLKADDTT